MKRLAAMTIVLLLLTGGVFDAIVHGAVVAAVVLMAFLFVGVCEGLPLMTALRRQDNPQEDER